ncbi:hypothetical protein ACX93W_05105 [Paenibacillus sp. CAU 1782]
MKKSFVYYSWLILGFSGGNLLSFFILVLLLQEGYFEKPLDSLWSGFFELSSSLLGGLVGGLTAYFVAKYQIKSQHEVDSKNKDNAQKIIFNIISEEMKMNHSVINDITDIIPDSDYERFLLATSLVSQGYTEVKEALHMLLSDLTLDFLMQVRSELTNYEYINVHKAIHHLLVVSKLGEKIMELNNAENIANMLKQLRQNAIMFNEYYTNLKS